MARRKRMNDVPCPVARTLDAVGDRWALLIVRDAFDGVCRFSDLQRSLGVARNILSDRLRGLVQADILAVQPASDGTSYQEYVLTPKGRDLFPVIVALRQWGEGHLFAPNEPHSTLVEGSTGTVVAPMLPHGQDGRVLTADQTVVRKV